MSLQSRRTFSGGLVVVKSSMIARLQWMFIK
jgi:hypothetical protein